MDRLLVDELVNALADMPPLMRLYQALSHWYRVRFWRKKLKEAASGLVDGELE
jgi:hypothetical protein